MLTAGEVVVIFALDCGKACGRGDVPVVGAAPETLDTEIRKHLEEIACINMLSEIGSMEVIG